MQQAKIDQRIIFPQQYKLVLRLWPADTSEIMPPTACGVAFQTIASHVETSTLWPPTTYNYVPLKNRVSCILISLSQKTLDCHNMFTNSATNDGDLIFPNDAVRSSRYHTLTSVNCSLFAIMTIVVGVRMYARTIRNRSAGLDDVIIGVAYVCVLRKSNTKLMIIGLYDC
jgi:hypothetical protein